MMETLAPPNRRRTTRIPVELDGTIWASHRRFPCRIRNFCSGGLLLECKEFPAEFAGVPVRVDIRLPDEASQDLQALAFDIQIRHHEKPFLGVAFVRPPFGAIQQLYRLAQNRRSVLRPVPAQPVADGEISRFNEVFFRQLKPALINAFLQTAQEMKNDEAEGRNAEVPALLVRLYRTLERMAESLAEVLQHQVQKDVQEFLRAERPLRALRKNRAADLSLVERTDFEDWLAANIATRTIESELGLTQEKLNSFWAWALGYTLRSEENPCGAGNIIQRLQVRLKQLGLTDPELRVLYRHLSPMLAEVLKEVYGAALEHYQPEQPLTNKPAQEPELFKENKAAVSPTISGGGMDGLSEPDGAPQTQSSMGSATSRASAVSHTSGVSGERDEGPDTTASDSSDPTRADGLRALRSLRRINSRVTGVGDSSEVASPAVETLSSVESLSSGTNEHSDAYSSDQLNRVVGALARQFLEQDDTSSAPEMSSNLKQQVLQLLGHTDSGPHRPLPEPEGETIDVVDQLFGAMAGNPVMAAVLKRWLAQLKYLVLQVVLQEPEFFASNDHPLRILINRLGLLGAGRLPSGQLEPLVQNLFQSALEPQGWPEALTGLIQQSEDLLRKQENSFRRHGERIAKAAAGQEKLQLARLQVQADLEQRLAGKELAKPVLDLLYQLGWRQHLVVCLLKKEEKYREVLGLLDLLLEQPLKPELSGQSLPQSTLLLLMLKGELDAVGQFSSREQQWLSGVSDWLMQGQAPSLERVTEAGFRELESPYRIEAASLSPEGGNSAGGQGSQLESLEPGNWLWLRRMDGSTRYLRVAWVDKQGIRCSYINNQGIQESTLSWAEVHQHEAAGRLRLILEQELALVDHALYQVVHSAYSEVLDKVSRDPLTSCLTRHEFERQLERYLASSQSSSRAYLLLLDVDNFRVVNNSLGIQAGDAILRDLARLLRLYGGEEAILGRLGGNEFGLLLPGDSEDSGMDMAERIRAGIEKHDFSHEGHAVRVTLSIGAAMIRDPREQVAELIKRAGLVCLTAKEEGGNRILSYQPDSREQVRQREMMSWLTRLEEPLDGLLELRCQPIIRIDGEKRHGMHYEVLLGVREADGSLCSPVPLIEAAERFNRMARVDRWVIESVFRWLGEHPTKFEELGGLSINLSGSSLSDGGFLDDLLNLLKANQRLNSKVRFEITETAAVVNLGRLAGFARAAKRYGCSMSLDDFGTGLSSYAYLQQIPVDFLKIDGVFIRNLASNARDQALVKSIAELARFMGIQTIAEYVEDEASLEVLKQLGVNKAQGYYVGKPVLMSQL